MPSHFRRLGSLIIIAFSIASHAFNGNSRFSSLKRAISRYYPTPPFIPVRSNLQGFALSVERSYSPDFDTAFEWLAKDRALNEPGRHGEIEWFHPSVDGAANERRGIGKDDDDGEIRRMPIYPLGAVHIPHSGENHTIVNVEQKNVKMALDLIDGKWENSLFCASLRARDTNRIASVGTIMQLLDTEDRSISGARTWPGNIMPTLNRVIANCKAVGVVDILSIEEHDYEESDYLIAKVKVRNLPRELNSGKSHTIGEANSGENSCLTSEQVIGDYQKVRSIYINSQSLASNELPKFARKAVQTLPMFDVDVFRDEAAFWKLAETWQMLCNTIRQSKRTGLQSIVNELSVAAAMQVKGPLELPVKRKSLPPNVRRQLEDIEQRAIADFVDLGMDPVLDFQEILSLRRHRHRVEKLARMIRRERSRLEAKESLIRAFLDAELGEELLVANNSEDGHNEFG